MCTKTDHSAATIARAEHPNAPERETTTSLAVTAGRSYNGVDIFSVSPSF